MHFVIVKTGGRKFRCIRCDDVDPMQVPDFQAWAKSELRPPKATWRQPHALSGHRIHDSPSSQSFELEMVVRARRTSAENRHFLRSCRGNSRRRMGDQSGAQTESPFEDDQL